MGFSALGIEYGSYILVGCIFLLLLTGQPLAWVTGLVALIFTFGWFGGNALPLVTSRIFGFITEYSLVAIPMFILMAAMLDRSGIAKDLFNGMRVLAGRLPGGVAVQTLIVAILMAAMSGVIGGAASLRLSAAAGAEDAAAFAAGRRSALAEAESAAIGVDTDDELSKLLLVEQAYAANARVIRTMDDLLRLLMEI